ncbi:DUF1499 domain-containing protein [Oscillatoria sp. FACHB-1407]|nr:DUF1499 domain-containing protein [Oscillatoria sp. FACHB-1407]
MVFCWFTTITPVAAEPLSTVAIATSSSGGSTLFSFSGKRPTNLGVKDGKLAACPASPNCVNSQLEASDQEHAIAPLTYQSEPTKAMATLKSVIESMPRTKIISETDDYLYAEFTSALMGFVDDVEFYLSPVDGVIHVRSASRLGQSDLGVNRNRIEDIRNQFSALEAKA